MKVRRAKPDAIERVEKGREAHLLDQVGLTVAWLHDDKVGQVEQALRGVVAYAIQKERPELRVEGQGRGGLKRGAVM
jgi:hypothetical protein